MPTVRLPLFQEASPSSFIAQPDGVTKIGALSDNSFSTYITSPFPDFNHPNWSQFFKLQDTLTPAIDDLTGTVINSISLVLQMSPRVKNSGPSYSSVVAGLDYPGAPDTSLETVFENWVPDGNPSGWTLLNNETVVERVETFNQKRIGSPANTFVNWVASDLQNLRVHFRSLINTPSLHILKLEVVVDFTPATDPINAPTDLTVSDIDSDFVTLEWTDNSNVESGYEIFRSTNGLTWKSLGVVDPDVTTFTDSTVFSVTEYFYRVRAFNSMFESDWSNEVSDTTPAYSGPALDPTNFNAVALTNTSVQLVWENGGATDLFILEESPDEGTTWDEVAELDKTEPFFDITDKLPGSSYSYRVKAVNTVGESDWVEVGPVTFPERSFREFLQKEVLQDVVQFFGWSDRVKLPDQEFTVTQTFFGHTDLTAREIAIPISSIRIIFGPTVTTYKSTNALKLSTPLIGEIPQGTELFTIGTTTVYVGEDAAIGDDILYLYSQVSGQPLVPFMMSGGMIIDSGAIVPIQRGVSGEVIVGSNGPIISQEFTVTTTIDYSKDPNDASGVYDSITNDALLKIGFVDESEVPEARYQQFRDAGRVAAWRFVAYSSVYLNTTTTTVNDPLLGSVDRTDQFNQVFAMALQELDIAEKVYADRYESVVPTTPVVIPRPKPKASSYSNAVAVRF